MANESNRNAWLDPSESIDHLSLHAAMVIEEQPATRQAVLPY